MNHYGIAREAATIYSLELQPLDDPLPAPKPAARPVPVTIEEPKTLRPLHRSRIARRKAHTLLRHRRRALPPPRTEAHLQRRRRHQLLHPRHRPAHPRLRSRQTRRRNHRPPRPQGREAHASSTASERTLEADDLVVADEKKAVGLAGVMGGWDSMITADTQEHPDRGRVVRSRQYSSQRAPPRPAHRRLAPLRARRGLQRPPRGLSPRQQDHPSIRRQARGRAR